MQRDDPFPPHPIVLHFLDTLAASLIAGLVHFMTLAASRPHMEESPAVLCPISQVPCISLPGPEGGGSGLVPSAFFLVDVLQDCGYATGG